MTSDRTRSCPRGGAPIPRRATRSGAGRPRRADARGQAPRGQAQRGRDRLGDGRTTRPSACPRMRRGSARTSTARSRRAWGRCCTSSAGSAIAVPLEGEGDEAVGAIALYNSRKPAGFSQDDRALLRLVSANASTAVRLFRSRLERERSERLTTIGRLLSGVMHDMRTPLTVISGYVQLMATADRSGAARRPRAAHPEAVRPHQRDAARGARVRARRAEHPGAQGLPDQVLRRHRASSSGASSTARASSSRSSSRIAAPRASTSRR